MFRTLSILLTGVSIFHAHAGPEEPPPDSLVREDHRSWVTCAAFSLDGEFFVTASYDGTVRVWDAANVKLKRTIALNPDGGFSVHRIALSPDGKKVAAATPGESRLWVFEVATGKRVCQLDGHKGDPAGLGFLPDSESLLSMFDEDGVKRWNLKTGKEAEGWKLQVKFVSGTSMAVSANGKTLAVEVGDSPEVLLLDPATGAKLGVVATPAGVNVRAMAFSPDGTMLACGCDSGRCVLYDVAKQKALFGIAEPDTIYSVAFSPDNRTIALGGQGGTLKVFDIASEKELLRLDAHKRRTLCIAFSPDGKKLVTGGNDWKVRVWDLEKLLPKKPEK